MGQPIEISRCWQISVNIQSLFVYLKSAQFTLIIFVSYQGDLITQAGDRGGMASSGTTTVGNGGSVQEGL